MMLITAASFAILLAVSVSFGDENLVKGKTESQSNRELVINRSAWGALPARRCTQEESNFASLVASKQSELQKAYCGDANIAEAEKKRTDFRAILASRRLAGCVTPDSPDPATLVIHHSEGRVKKSEGGFVSPLDLQKTHIQSNGWADIGYHYVIAKDQSGKWQVFEGRERVKPCQWMKGSHVGAGANEGSVGIVIIGNYNSPQDDPEGIEPIGPNPPENEAIAKLKELVGRLKHECPQFKEVLGHDAALARAGGCLKSNATIDLEKGNCSKLKSENGFPFCRTTCPGSGCSHLPGLLSQSLN